MPGARLLNDDQRSALNHVEMARRGILEAIAHRDAAIKAAHAAGCSLRSIEEVAKLSHERVRQIILSQQAD